MFAALIFDIIDLERAHFVVEVPIHPAFIEEGFLNFDGQFSDQESDRVRIIATLLFYKRLNQIIKLQLAYKSNYLVN